MTDEHSPAGSTAPIRARRWTGASRPPGNGSGRYRLVLRLIGIPVLAVAGVIIYRGIREHLVLPACDSDTAKQTLAQVLKELKLEPTRYAPIKTISSSKDKVVCNAVMPLPDGGSVVADYSFYWQGSKATMRYSIHRQAAQSSLLGTPHLASLRLLVPAPGRTR
jgi:hypothetical protein